MLGWMRVNRSVCGVLALFALALQLYLAFGHVHAEDLGLAPQAVSAEQNSAAHEDGSVPTDRDDRDSCAICIALALTGNSVAPQPPALALPFAHDFAWPQDFLSARRELPFAAPFQARAPPSA
jgi:hypothetical protein